MSTKFVQSNQVLGQNGQAYVYLDYVLGVVTGIGRQLNCLNLQIVGSFWKIPKIVGNKVQGYTYLEAVNDSTPPTVDAFKVLSVTDTSDMQNYEIAIANTDNMGATSPPNRLAYLCDGSGGSLPIMPTVTIPFPDIEFPPTSTDGTDNVFTFPFPANPNSLLYSIPAPYFNHVAGAPAYVPAGITTPALFVTWANSNWSAYGTWASSGNIVTLTSSVSNVTSAGMVVALSRANFCFNLSAYSTPTLVNGVKFGTGDIISVPAFQLTNDPNVLAAVLRKVMSAASTTFDTTSVAHKLGVATVYATPKLYVNTSLVVSASSGAC